MATKKLKSFNPLIRNNNHVSWESSHGKTMYKFLVTFENDESIYEANSISTTPKWEIGANYDCTIREATNPKYNPSVSMKMIKDGYSHSTSSYNNPDNVKKVSMSVAQSAAVDTYVVFGKVGSTGLINKLSDLIYSWIIKEGLNRDTCSLRHNAMLRMSNIFKLFPEKSFNLIKDHEQFNHAAFESMEKISNAFMNHLENITNSNKEQQQSSQSNNSNNDTNEY